MAEPSDERPKEGDLLVAIEGERQTPLEPKDIPAGGPPVLAWPMDLAANVVRSGSRLNKVLLLRLDPSTLAGVTKERAEGVVAYSAICPHCCEVSALRHAVPTIYPTRATEAVTRPVAVIR